MRVVHRPLPPALTALLLATLLFRGPVCAQGSPAGPPTLVRICPAPGPNCDWTSISSGLSHIGPGSTVVVAAGIYREGSVLRANKVILRAKPGAHIENTAAEGKAALVVKGDDTVIEGLECSGIAVPSRNGACIRLEGHNLTLKKVYFHDSEEGVLTAPETGTITVEDSKFERLGVGGLAHALYIGEGDRLIIRRSQILSSRGEGHEVKSRAAVTLIEDSVIASLDGLDSRLVDVPNGGELTIRRTLLEKGPMSSNDELIGFGLEGVKYPVNRVRIEECMAIVDRPDAHLFAGPVKPAFARLRVIGGEKIDAAGVTWFASRRATGLAPYPFLPAR